ncbi:hypothetical protein KKC49_00730 [Patescibacteria group bacterium]|nr:hypothetical protein [Patescibacteria group bacterium]MBU4367378.1 hypothetical protein [Patescibacteria group bacterium]MBU4461699.1 hypothetical protein [Patescibacteria group bacterium]MCG2700495.1 hypothetical protein [Candidatus Parcubacteria bacterium]
MIFKSTILKIPIILAISLVVFYLGCEAGYQTKYRLELWKDYRAMEKFNQSIIDMFKNDTYGGKTPEETFNMFVSALKNEDVDLAVKYFILDPDRRARYWEQFDNLKQEGKLKEYAEDWPKWEEFKIIKDDYNNWEDRAMVEHTYHRFKEERVNLPDGAGGYIETVLPIGEYVDYAPVFTKNINDIWKIENL